jgi:hypothetical protein
MFTPMESARSLPRLAVLLIGILPIGSGIAFARPPCRAAAPATRSIGGEECTIAVLTGAATRDGRPILWKNRDAAYTDNEVIFLDDGGYRSVALVNAGDRSNAWIGVNEKGFAILNALSYNLPDTVQGGITNGELMRAALRRCATVADFESYMRETDKTGRENPANIAVIDARGGGAVFEAAGRNYVRFDAKGAPGGFLARTNFSLAGDTSYVDTWRYHRCRSLIKEGIGVGGLDVTTVLQRIGRDIRAVDCDPYPLPYEGAPPGFPKSRGYVETSNTINRRTSVSGGAVLGVLPDEDPLLSTFYAVVGQPVVAIPLPVWVAAGDTPPELDGPATSPLCDLAKERIAMCYDDPAHPQLINTYKLVSSDPTRAGFQTRAERVERWLFNDSYAWLDLWRSTGADPAEMVKAEREIAARAFDHYRSDPEPVAPRLVAMSAQPNPARGSVEIRFEAEEAPPPGGVISVIDPSGRRVASLSAAALGASRRGILRWDGRDARGVPVASGVYFLRPTWSAETRGGPIVIAR